jgi:hypothetical protein
MLSPLSFLQLCLRQFSLQLFVFLNLFARGIYSFVNFVIIIF